MPLVKTAGLVTQTGPNIHSDAYTDTFRFDSDP